jgi:hypothetical protein
MKGSLLDILPPSGWLFLAAANVFFSFVSVASENPSLSFINVLSATSCFLAYFLSKS